MKTAGRENPNYGVAWPRNRAHGAIGQNRSRSIKWAAKQEKFQPKEMCFFLTSPFIEPIVRWGGQSTLYGLTTVFRGVFYEDYVKIDYSVWPDTMLDRISAEPHLPDCLDVGYRVILDKDNRSSRWKPPSYKAHIPARPTESEYRTVIEEFWWEATYVARSLQRGDLVFAKFGLDYQIKLEVMRRMFEWRIEIEHSWRIRPGVYGRNMNRLMPADIWEQWSRTYVGSELEENWVALFRTTELFRRVSREVGAALGHTYPAQLDDEVTAYLNALRTLPGEVKGALGPLRS
jgi:aminoglycoside 6-adenylyltransferase